MNVLEQTYEKLKELPEDKLSDVADYVDSLCASNSPGRFDSLAGCMGSKEVSKMRDAIESLCQQIDDE